VIIFWPGTADGQVMEAIKMGKSNAKESDARKETKIKECI
jgi:hypothetical protein